MDGYEVVVGRRRGRRWRRVSHGLHRAIDPALRNDGRGLVEPDAARRQAREELLADLRALQQVLPPSACFTHLTAAEVHGLWLPPLPDAMPFFVCIPKGEERPRRRGLVASRLTASFTPVTVHGLRLAPLPEVLHACGRDLGLLDLVVLLDSAVQGDRCSLRDIAENAGPRRRGAPALRQAISYADDRSESPWESLLRMFHVLCDVPVEPQFEVYDEEGRCVARGDLRISGTRTLHEYDGAVHLRRTHVADLARDRRLVNAGWLRRGYTVADLLARSHMILREADAAPGRPCDPRRLDVWRDALRSSLFSATGQGPLPAWLGLG